MLDYGNYEDRSWPVYSDCKFVRIRSKKFETEKEYDFVTIGNIHYSGKDQIDIIHSSNFTVNFHSDKDNTEKGFVLKWNCLTQWEEWMDAADGTCREAMRLQPEYNGPDIKYRTKYRKTNKTCGKFFCSKYCLIISVTYFISLLHKLRYFLIIKNFYHNFGFFH